MTGTLLASLAIARNNLSGRPWRTALIVGAVAIAGSLAVAVSCAISSVQGSMELALERILGKADARIIHPGLGRFDDEILEQVRSWPEVEHASGRVVATLTFVHSDRRVDEKTGRVLRASPSAIGIDFVEDARFLELDLIAGHMPAHDNEILLDSITTEELKASVGDELRLDHFGAPIHFTVAGVFERQRLLGAVQRPQVRLDRRTLERAVGGIRGELSSIMILTRSGVDVQQFCEARGAELPEAINLEPAERVRSGFDRRIAASRIAVVITSILTFMSASFIIVTALTTSVTERQREMAVIRSIGASRRQIFLSQISVGVILGLIGAAIAIPMGIGLAAVLISWFSEELPAGLAISRSGIVLAVGGSIAAGLVGALYPAYIASRVTPMQAMAWRARPPRVIGIVACTFLGFVFIAAQLALLSPRLPGGVDGQFYRYVYVGLPGVHIGYFVLAVPVVILLSLVIAPLISRLLRLPKGVLAQSILATPYRHGFTAGALMVGVSILVSTWGGMASLMNDWVSTIRFPDGFAYHPTGLSPRQQRTIQRMEFVEDACPIGMLQLRVAGQQVFGLQGLSPAFVMGAGADPKRFLDMNAVKWVQGTREEAVPRLMDGDAILVSERFLVARNLGIGDRLTLASGRTEKSFEIVGVVSVPGLEIAIQSFGVRSAYMELAISMVLMSDRALAEHFQHRDAHVMQVNLDDSVSDEEVEAAIARAAPGVRFRSGRWILDKIYEFLGTLLAIQTVIAFSALFLACIGAGNVIVANIHARRYEYGVLRATGAHRGVLLRLIMAEAGVLAIAGAVVGTVLGLHLTWVGTVFYRELAGIELRTTFATLPVAIGWGVLVLMTIAAAAPAAISLMRQQPAALLSTGRNG